MSPRVLYLLTVESEQNDRDSLDAFAAFMSGYYLRRATVNYGR